MLFNGLSLKRFCRNLLLSRRTPVQYHIEVKGHLDSSWETWFAPLHIRHGEAGTTRLSGMLPDQSALYGVLMKIDRLGLTLRALESTEAVHDPEITQIS